VSPLVLLVMLVSLESESPLPALRGLDPVLLGRGEERVGLESLSATQGRYLYRFATEETKQAFEADPEAHGIQWGGGCGRMGPLSGAGSPDRFAVFDGRIWIFASDGCLAGFQKNPASFEWKESPAPASDEQSRDAGKQIFERMMAAMGAPERLGRFSRYHERVRVDAKNGDADVVRIDELAVTRSGDIRSAISWDSSTWAFVRSSGSARATAPNREPSPLVASQVRELERIADHHLVAILFARDRQDFVVVHRGVDGNVPDAPDLLEVHFDGQLSTLGVHQRTGRPVFLRFHGRTGSGRCDAIEDRFTDWKEVDGLALPHRVERTFAGKPVEHGRFVSTTIEIDDGVGTEIFVH
jgi:YHS domain-containing protein